MPLIITVLQPGEMSVHNNATPPLLLAARSLAMVSLSSSATIARIPSSICAFVLRAEHNDDFHYRQIESAYPTPG
jgi:hypothetical protein